MLNVHFGKKKTTTQQRTKGITRFVSLSSPEEPSHRVEVFTVRLVFTVILVRRRVQEHQGEDVEVPHPVDAGEEGAVHLYRDVPPLPVAFGHLPGRKQIL